MKRKLVIILVVFSSLVLIRGVVGAASERNITKKLGGNKGDLFTLNGTFFTSSLKVSNTSQFLGSISNPKGDVVIGDNLRVDGSLYTGTKSGPGNGKPFTVNDDIKINGTLTVGSTNIITAINSISDHDTLGSLSCSSGQIAKRGTSGWECGSDIDTNTDSLANLTCSHGDIIYWTGLSWACTSPVWYGSGSNKYMQIQRTTAGVALSLKNYSDVQAYLQLDDTGVPYSSPSVTCSSDMLGSMTVDVYANKLWICMAGGWKSFTAD